MINWQQYTWNISAIVVYVYLNDWRHEFFPTEEPHIKTHVLVNNYLTI